jgi:hypothetical protein
VELWTGCVAGALVDSEYERLLAAAGFDQIDIEPTRIYSREDARALLGIAGLAEDEDLLAATEGKVMSAFVRATKVTPRS